MDTQHEEASGRRFESERNRRDTPGETLRDYARGAAGGLIVGLPLLMTMEMWWQGFVMSPHRMLLFLAFNFGILVILERYSGFRADFSLLEELQDAVVAMGIGLVTSTVILFLLNVIRIELPLQEIAGKIIVESFPVSIGVSVAVSQLGSGNPQMKQRKQEAGFWGMLAIGAAGAMYFGLNIAVTEEPVMITMRADWWHVLFLLLLSLVLSHAIVYAVEFRGTHKRPEGQSWIGGILKQGMSSYALSLLIAAFLLWIFGRFDPETGLAAMVYMTVVLGLVTSLGSAAGNLLL